MCVILENYMLIRHESSIVVLRFLR